MAKSLVQEQFGANADAYATSKVHAKGASLARLVELVQPQADWEALDVASAAGHTAFAFAPHVAHVIATDITAEMLPVAERVAAEKGISNYSLEIADAESLPFPESRFDLVTCRIAPHHFQHIERFLAEAARVLRHGGILAVVDNVVPGSQASGTSAEESRAAGCYVNDFEKMRDPSHHRALSLDEWLEGFRQAQFTALQYETARKKMEFQPWAERMGATPETIERLGELLVEAPERAAEYLQPEEINGECFFYLTEAIVIGKKG